MLIRKNYLLNDNNYNDFPVGRMIVLTCRNSKIMAYFLANMFRDDIKKVQATLCVTQRTSKSS